MKLNLLKYEDLKKLVELVFPNLIPKDEKEIKDHLRKVQDEINV